MIKLIASDMDGTLLDSNKNINPEFYDILRNLKSENILFSAISGRDLQSLKTIFKDVEEQIIFAANNGNYIIHNNEVIYENYIDKEKIIKIVDVIRKGYKHSTIYCTKDCSYSESIMPGLLIKLRHMKSKIDIKVVKDITKIEDKIIKVTAFGNQKIIDKCLKDLQVFKEELMITPSGKTCIDICQLGGDKGEGIRILQEKFNIKYEETMVFGDHMNDLEMMDSAYYSYAMENAKSEVKNKARFIAKCNDENGVIEAIKEVVLKESFTV